MLLALETSSLRGSVAVWQDGNVLAFERLPEDQRSGRSLVPTIARIVERLGLTPRDVRQIAVTAGPGSFTGLRIGVTAAKTLAFAVQAQVLGIDTLDALANSVEPRPDVRFHSLIEAHRGQMFHRAFAPDQVGRLNERPGAIVDWNEFVAIVRPGDAIVGPPGSRWKALAEKLLPGSTWIEAEPDARAVARLAAEGFSQGRSEDIASFAPRYVRPAAAEEKAGSLGRYNQAE